MFLNIAREGEFGRYPLARAGGVGAKVGTFLRRVGKRKIPAVRNDSPKRRGLGSEKLPLGGWASGRAGESDGVDRLARSPTRSRSSFLIFLASGRAGESDALPRCRREFYGLGRRRLFFVDRPSQTPPRDVAGSLRTRGSRGAFLGRVASDSPTRPRKVPP